MMQRFFGIPKHRMSTTRRNLFIVSIEGIPAMLTLSLLNAPFITGYLLMLGANSFQIGLIVAIPTLMNLLQIPAAYLMQRIENRNLMFIISTAMHRGFWALTGAVPFLVGADYYFALYLVFYLIAFTGNAVSSVVWTSLVADMVPAQVRGQYFGFRNTLLWAVTSFGLFLGGYILEQVPGLDGYHILFIIIAVGAALNVVAMFLYPKVPFEKSPSPNLRMMIRQPFKNAVFAKSMSFITGWQFLQTLVVPLFSYIMLSVMGLGEYIVSMLTIVQTVSMMLSYYFWGRLNARIPARKLLLWTFPLIAAACLLWGATLILPTLLVLVLIHIFLGAGLGGNQMLVFNFLIGDSPKDERPMYIAVFSAVTGIASFLGPTVGGLIFDLIVDMPLWLQTAGVTSTVGILLFALAGIWGPVIFADQKRKLIR